MHTGHKDRMVCITHVWCTSMQQVDRLLRQSQQLLDTGQIETGKGGRLGSLFSQSTAAHIRQCDRLERWIVAILDKGAEETQAESHDSDGGADVQLADDVQPAADPFGCCWIDLVPILLLFRQLLLSFLSFMLPSEDGKTDGVAVPRPAATPTPRAEHQTGADEGDGPGTAVADEGEADEEGPADEDAVIDRAFVPRLAAPSFGRIPREEGSPSVSRRHLRVATQFWRRTLHRAR
eukprot:630228-Alexandrium_andersonii.AAC.1